jgi:hypothetical protein
MMVAMRLLRLSDVETGPRDRVFYYSRTHVLLIALIAIAASAALLFRAFSAHWKPGYYLGAVILLFLTLMHRFITARFRPSNWLARMNDLGLFIQFRSYLNYHLPADDLTVVFVPYQEIRSAGLVRERTRVPDTQGRTATQILRYIELELAGDTGALAKALQAEIGEKAPNEKHWYGSSSTLYEDYPVRMPSPPFLRMKWQVVPRAQKFLDAIRPWTTIADPVSVSQDFAHLQGLTREEQQKQLRELTQRGETIAAIYTARRLYGCGLEDARSMVEGLRNQPVS